MRALGYVFVSDVGELPARSATIRAWCAERGVALATVVHDADRHRPSLAWALEQIEAGGASALIVSRLRDLAGDAGDLVPLLRWFAAPPRALVALDLALDTSGDEGRAAAAAIADLLVRPDASAAPVAGFSRGSAHGRTAVADVPEVSSRIAAMRSAGMTLQAIADALNEDGVPTVRGGRLWRPSSVQRATGYRRPSAPGRGIELPKRVRQ
jgi:DNA invertase Pin-like site-specific DNA recombinase